MVRPFLPLLTLLPLAGCATAHGPYPSLAPRGIEKGSFDEPVRPVAVVTPDATLDAQITRDGQELDRIAGGFAAVATTARTRVAAAERTTVGSDAWLAAQAAIAMLDDWRSQATALAAAIEDRGSARAGRLLPPYPALDTLAARTAAEADRESAAIEGLQRRVPAA